MLTSSLFKAKTNITKKNKVDDDIDPRKSLALSRMQAVLSGQLNDQAAKSANISEFQKVNQSFFSSLKLNLKYVLPKSCRFACCKETTKDRLFFEGYKKLKKEIEIQTILKSLRLVKAAAKLNFTED